MGLLDSARLLAFSRLAVPYALDVDSAFAQSFLTREIIALHQEGVTSAQALADRSVGRLREYLQVKASAAGLKPSHVQH